MLFQWNKSMYMGDNQEIYLIDVRGKKAIAGFIIDPNEA